MALRTRSSATRKAPAKRSLRSRDFWPPGYVVLGVAVGLAGPRAAIAQDSQPQRTLVEERARPVYPLLRPLIIQSGLLPARRVTAKYDGVDLQDAQSHPGHQLRVLAAAPVFISKPVILLAGVSYLREQGSYDGQLSTAGPGAAPTLHSYVRQDISLSLSAMRRDSLFHRPVTYIAAVTSASREFGWPEKFTGGLTALFSLRSTPTTKLSLGLTVQINPSIKIPVTPLLTYWHRFGRSPWELDMLLPQRAHLRRPLLAGKGWLSLGTDILNTHSFGSGLVPGFNSTFESNTVSVQTGAAFEYPLNPYFMVGIRGGVDSPVTMWVGEKDSSLPIIEAKAGNAAYVGLILSVTMPARKH